MTFEELLERVAGLLGGARIPYMVTGSFASSMLGSDGTVLAAPRYRGVVVESWSVGGTLERVDSLSDARGAMCYQLFASGDTLVLTRDSAANTCAGIHPCGVMAIPLETHRLLDLGGGWIDEGNRRGLGLEVEWLRMNRLVVGGMSGLGYVNLFAEGNTSIITWGGLQWDEAGWSLFARAPNDKFPWFASTVAGGLGYWYRGNGAKVPWFLLWKGFLISWDADYWLHGLYPAR